MRREAKQANRYDPTAPLTGKRFRRELRAAEGREFGPQQRELNTAIANQDQTTADRARYYDDWRQAMRESTARINATNAENVKASEARVDSSYAQDSAAVKARDVAASEQAAKLGRGPVQSAEGARAVEAQRSQGNQSTDRLRSQAGADTKYLELRGVNAAQAKIEDQDRQGNRRKKLEQAGRDLARERGQFRTEFGRKARESEREWAAIQKEFGLKSRELDIDAKNSRKDRQLEQQKLSTQKIVARIYASADRAGARAQVRVAKLQLQKGKISQKQYREIVNIYKGLPKKGSSGAAGPKPLTATQEKTVKQAFNRLKKAGVRADQKKAAINQLIGKYGYPPRVAREAWRRYVRRAPGMDPGSVSPNEGNTP